MCKQCKCNILDQLCVGDLGDSLPPIRPRLAVGDELKAIRKYHKPSIISRILTKLFK